MHLLCLRCARFSWHDVPYFVDILPRYKVFDGVCPGDTSKSSILTLSGRVVHFLLVPC